MLQGIDISHWQETTPGLGGVDFLIARATYGTAPDDRYRRHVANARARDLVVGAYHFGRRGDVAGQVEAYVKAAGDVDLYVLDLEADGDDPPMTKAEARDWIVRARTALDGRPIGLYHSTSGYPPDALGADWRWVADYRRIQKPPIKFDIWQWQGSPLDRDHFRGTRAELLELGGGKDDVGLHLTLPSAVIAGTLDIPIGTDSIRVADGEHYKVPKSVRRPAVTAALAGGVSTTGWVVDLHGDELHFIRNGPQLTFTPASGVDCGTSVTAERDRVKAAVQIALDGIA